MEMDDIHLFLGKAIKKDLIIFKKTKFINYTAVQKSHTEKLLYEFFYCLRYCITRSLC
jgi:hypothetical protein